MSTNQDLHQRRHAAIARGVSNMHSIYTQRASNAELWDVEGKRYIDFAGGIAVLNTGHCHPKLMAAVQAQMQRFTHTCFQVTGYDNYVELAERLNAVTPGDHAKKTLFLTSGAEAVENAVKIARSYTKRRGVIAFDGAYHGRTGLTMALTGKVAGYKAGFGPLPGEIYHIPYPNPLHGVTEEQALQALQMRFKVDLEPEQIAAIILEPVQGEGGFYVAPPSFMRKLREICDQHGILLIVDEVQTGFARTGKMFAIEHSNVIDRKSVV